MNSEYVSCTSSDVLWIGTKQLIAKTWNVHALTHIQQKMGCL